MGVQREKLDFFLKKNNKENQNSKNNKENQNYLNTPTL
jgi:hypothetical protein